MKTKLTIHKPSLKLFLLRFLAQLALLTPFIAIIYFAFNEGESVAEYFKSVSVIFLMMPLFNAASATYTARRHQLTISEVDDAAHVADWAVELLEKNGLRIKTVTDSITVLESDKMLLRALGNWFGAELVEVRQAKNEVIVIGHSKYVDIPDSKIKFGSPKQQFQNIN